MQASFPECRLFQVTCGGDGPPEKTVLYTGRMTAAVLEPDETCEESKAEVPDDMHVLVLSCGDVLSYPIFGQPVGRYESGLFVVPAGMGGGDVVSEVGAADAVGLPFTSFGFQVHEDQADILESLIRGSADFADRRKCYAAKKVSEASNVVSKGIGKSAKLFSKGLGRASGFVKSRLKKSEKEDGHYDKTKAVVGAVKNISGTTIDTVTAVSNTVISSTISASKMASARINHTEYVRALKSKRRAKRLQNRRNKPSVTEQIAHGAAQVMVAGGEGAVGVFFALEEASECMLDESVSAVSSVVGHVAGKEAGEITTDVLGVAEDGFKLYKSVGKGGKSFGKSVAKSAAMQGGINAASALVADDVRDSEDAVAGASEAEVSGVTRK